MEVKNIELKVDHIKDGKITAYLTTFGNEDRVGDIVVKGALDEYVQGFDPEINKLPMLMNHDMSQIIGEWTELAIDDYGLKAVGVLYTETTDGADALALLKRDALEKVSIGYITEDYAFNEESTRLLKKITLVEGSLVLRPANVQAEILSVKSEDGLIEAKAVKAVLKQAGLSTNEVNALFMDGWKGLKSMKQDQVEEDTAETKLLAALADFKL